MVVGEFTASNIPHDEDKREEKKKVGIVDMVKVSLSLHHLLLLEILTFRPTALFRRLSPNGGGQAREAN